MTVHPTHPTGIRARIPKGTEITGTFPGSAKTAGRMFEVDVFNLYSGYVSQNSWDTRHRVGRHAEVVWVGSGGYWHHAALEDVEIIEGQERVADVARWPLVTRAEVVAAFEAHPDYV